MNWRNLYNKVVYLGLTRADPEAVDTNQTLRRIVLSNQIDFVLILISFQYIFLFPLMGYRRLGLIAGLVVLGFVISLVLNAFRFFLLSKILMIVTLVSLCYFFPVLWEEMQVSKTFTFQPSHCHWFSFLPNNVP